MSVQRYGKIGVGERKGDYLPFQNSVLHFTHIHLESQTERSQEPLQIIFCSLISFLSCLFLGSISP